MAENAVSRFRTRAEAASSGARKYFTGKPCKHGHVEERYTKDGNCLRCSALKVQRRMAEDPDGYKRYHRDYVRSDRGRAARRQWAQQNVEAMRARRREAYAANPEPRLAQGRIYRKLHKDKQSAAVRSWNERNPERYKAIQRRSKAKKKSDPFYRLSNSMRAGISRYVKIGEKKGARTFDFLPYSVGRLKKHLERLFKPGMSWENYGSWHIDHIRPLASFTYTTMADPQFQEAWALSNLQPLWAHENHRKGARLGDPA